MEVRDSRLDIPFQSPQSALKMDSAQQQVVQDQHPSGPEARLLRRVGPGEDPQDLGGCAHLSFGPSFPPPTTTPPIPFAVTSLSLVLSDHFHLPYPRTCELDLTLRLPLALSGPGPCEVARWASPSPLNRRDIGVQKGNFLEVMELTGTWQMGT